jgi:hypothetical protein
MIRGAYLARMLLGFGLGFSLFAVACGSSTQPPSVLVTISPRVAYVPLSYAVQFSVTVAGTSNARVVWTVNNVVGGSSTFGFISTAGFYRAPARIPSPSVVTVAATSQEDNTKTASATVTVVTQTSGANAVQVASAQTISNINVQVPTLTPTLSIYGAGECSGSTCSTAATGLQVAQGGTATIFLTGAGLVSGTVYSISGNPADVTVVQPSGSQFGSINDGTPSVAFDITVSPDAVAGLRNIMVSNPNTGELSVFVGGLLITPPGS